MDQFIWTVYKTVCLVNTKFYFGIHKTKDPNDRYLGSGMILRRAIRKYGRKNFIKQVLFVFDTKDKADYKEIELIGAEINNPKCYNIARGGQAGWEYVNRSGIVSRHWHDNKDNRRRAISEAVRKKWADPAHHKIHAAANRSPKAKARQSAGHIKQWAKLTITELSEIGKRRAARWAAMTPERKELFKTKVSLSRRLNIDRDAVVKYTVEHPELSYREISPLFNISEMTVRRICLLAGLHRKSGTRPGSRRKI